MFHIYVPGERLRGGLATNASLQKASYSTAHWMSVACLHCSVLDGLVVAWTLATWLTPIRSASEVCTHRCNVNDHALIPESRTTPV